jgi:predicted Ser/Thr protein kinase
MELEDLIDAHLAGESPDVPADLRDDYERAIAAHRALYTALNEETAGPGGDRHPPALPAPYELVSELGMGGMGVVYLARHRMLDRLVAVKVLNAPGPDSETGPARLLLEEARHLAQLRHPNIVAVHEVGDAEGEPYFVMDYVDGRSLAALIARGPLTPSHALAILRPAAEAVHYAHRQGIVHLDLKPGNILIDASGHVFVTDFGLARDRNRPDTSADPSPVRGTPAYMAPEQVEGRPDRVGEATDIHALGAILYEMVTGRPPYGNDAPARILARIRRGDPIPPHRLDGRIPRDLEVVCLKALAPRPDRRYASIGALLEDLRRYELGVPPLARRVWTTYRAYRLARRHWRRVLAALAVPAAASAAWIVFGPTMIARRDVSLMLAEANWRHAQGDHVEAVAFCTAAIQQHPDESRIQGVPERIVHCLGEIQDPAEAIKAALSVVPRAPKMSFGRLDLSVAHALLRRAETIRARNLVVRGAQSGPDSEYGFWLGLAIVRFDLALARDDLSSRERGEVEQARTAAAEALSDTEGLSDRDDRPPRGAIESHKPVRD